MDRIFDSGWKKKRTNIKAPMCTIFAWLDYFSHQKLFFVEKWDNPSENVQCICCFQPIHLIVPGSDTLVIHLGITQYSWVCKYIKIYLKVSCNSESVKNSIGDLVGAFHQNWSEFHLAWYLIRVNHSYIFWVMSFLIPGAKLHNAPRLESWKQKKTGCFIELYCCQHVLKYKVAHSAQEGRTATTILKYIRQHSSDCSVSEYFECSSELEPHGYL